MSLFPDAKTFIQVGPFSIQWYAMFYLISAIVAYYLVQYRFKRVGYSKKDIELSDYIINTLFVGIIGGRIWYVLFVGNHYYLAHPFSIFKIWEGGLAIQGGVIAGLLYSLYYMKKKHISIPVAADVIMPCMLFCQAIGRWGNFINQEAHGPATTRDFLVSLHLPQFVIEGMRIQGVYYHPTFLYESILNVIGFLIIVIGYHYFQKRKGSQFFAYFVWYGAVRFFIEMLRTDPLLLFGMRMSMLTAACFFIFGVVGLYYVYRQGEKIEGSYL